MTGTRNALCVDEVLEILIDAAIDFNAEHALDVSRSELDSRLLAPASSINDDHLAGVTQTCQPNRRGECKGHVERMFQRVQSLSFDRTGKSGY